MWQRLSRESSVASTVPSNQTRLRRKLYDHRGLLATFVGTFCNAAQSILVKLLKDDDIPVFELVCLRFILQGIFSFLFGLFTRMEFRIRSKREAILLVARSLPATFAMVLFYYAMFNMSVGSVNTIAYGSPVFMGIFAWIFVKEPFRWLDIILVSINLAGVVLIAQPPFFFRSEELDSAKKTELFAVVAAISGMLLTTLANIAVRLLGLMDCGASKMVFYYSICGAFVPIIAGLAMRDWIVPPCGRSRYYIVLIGLNTFLYNGLLAYGLACTKKTYFVSVVNSNQVPVTIVLEIIILKVIPNWIGVLGVCLVLGSAFGVVFREGRIIRKQSRIEMGDPSVREGETDETFPLSELDG